MTATEAVSATQWKAIKDKTVGTVTAGGNFEGALSDFATSGGTTTNWDLAAAANAAKSVTITGAALGANDIAALNQLTGDGTHSGSVIASVSAGLGDIGVGTLNSSNTKDTIAFEITGTLVNGDINNINTLRNSKTAGKITIR